MWNLLYAFILLTSIAFLPIPDAFGLPKTVVFIIGGFLLVAMGLMNKESKFLTLRNKWIGATFIYVILSSFGYHFFLPLLTNTNKFIGFSLNANLSTMTIILSILIVQSLVEWTDDLEKWVKVGKFLCWLGFGFSIYALLQFCGVDQIFHKDFYWMNSTDPGTYQGDFFKNYRMITFLGNKRETACFLALLSPMCLMFKGLRYKIIYGVMILVILLANSFTSTLAIVVSLLVYLLLTRRWKLLLLWIMSIPLIGYWLLKIYPSFFNFYGKGELWKDIFLGSLPKFFFGHGIGSFPLLRYKVGTTVAINAEFELLQLLSDGGIILVILVIGYIVTLYRRLILEFLSSNSMLLIGYTVGLTTFLTLSIGASPLHYPALFLVGIVYVSALEAQTAGE